MNNQNKYSSENENHIWNEIKSLNFNKLFD